MIVYTEKPIKKGEELLINYGSWGALSLERSLE
jgi:hypothetical protein